MGIEQTISSSRSIEQFFAEFVVAFNRGDLEGLRSRYTDDAVLMPPGQSALTGPAEIISSLWAPLFEAFEVVAELPILECQSWGAWGFVRGIYQMELKPPGGGASIRDAGQYIDVVKKDLRGEWKIARAIWNSTTN